MEHSPDTENSFRGYRALHKLAFASLTEQCFVLGFLVFHLRRVVGSLDMLFLESHSLNIISALNGSERLL